MVAGDSNRCTGTSFPYIAVMIQSCEVLHINSSLPVTEITRDHTESIFPSKVLGDNAAVHLFLLFINGANEDGYHRDIFSV